MYTNKESITWKCLHYQSSTYKHHSRQIKTRKLKVLKKIFWREPYCLFPFSSSGNIVMSQQLLTTKLTFYHKVANCLMFKQKTSRIDKNMQMIHIRKLHVPSDSLCRKISWGWLTSKYWGTQRHKWQKKKNEALLRWPDNAISFLWGIWECQAHTTICQEKGELIVRKSEALWYTQRLK